MDKLEFAIYHQDQVNIPCYIRHVGNENYEVDLNKGYKFLMDVNNISIKKKKLIICGAGACGKDFMKNRLRDEGMMCEVSYTTRDPRENEVDGVDYHFVTELKFDEMISNNEFLQYNVFGTGKSYGTSMEEWHKNDCFIMTPSGVAALTDKQRLDACVIYVKIKESTRKARLKARSDAGDSVERRLDTDRTDFHDFVDFDFIETAHILEY